MSEKAPFTVEQFYKNINQRKLLAAKCMKCGKIHLPPRPICNNCYCKDLEWTSIQTKGKLLTYTVIHIAPAKFQSMTPYAIGIVQLEPGLRMPGMIRDVSLDQLKIGMNLSIEYEGIEATQSWPQWPRYYFKPV
jgi:uncharacterized OB-fold protein